MASQGAPVTSRIAVIDTLRGAAMFGIIMVNIWFFASSQFNAGGVVPAEGQVAYAVITLLFTTKSYLLFAFLFGYSFVLQDNGPRFPGRMRRRLVALIVLGLLHALLLFPGDILLVYGILGFALLAMRSIAARAAVRRGALLTAATGILLLAVAVMAGTVGDGEIEVDIDSANAGALGVIEANLATYPSTLVSTLLVQGPPALAAMLWGMAAARSGVLRDPAATARVWRRLAGWGPAVGVIGAVAFTALTLRGTVASVFAGLGVSVLTAPFLTTTYVALLVVLQRRMPGNVVVRGIGSVGRIALTNYLCQSLVMAVLFTGYGFGLMDSLSGAQILAATVAIYALQVLASSLWLRRHSYGPAEWLLRRWTLAGG